MINSGSSVSEVLKNWPFLGKPEQLLHHFRMLTSIDIEVCMRSAIQRKANNLYMFFSSERQTNAELKHALLEVSGMMDKSDQHLPNRIFVVLMAYFHEATHGLILFDEVWI